MRDRIVPCSEGIMQTMTVPRAEKREMVADPDTSVARLSQGQIDCLLLVDQHHSSKEIALRLGISPHTVDQRIRGALEKLGVDRRGEAARLVVAALSASDGPYQRLIHQPPHIDPQELGRHQGGTIGKQIRHADRAGEANPPGVITEQRSAGLGSPLQLPFATRSQPSNEMSMGLRLVWILLIAIGATFSAGMYLAGLESLSRLLTE
ncbi:helix-turn-helix domain-containing protein [Sphingomonas xanthus]|uniref:Helix-turn-helix transcriptional regulator n=1 Tax=Sphingomonas xanthus TaxID=2594473 RepID=A0A516IQN8_9SPHN|nr:helix-turn-helix transcriptional regulator [Sphingomonas xanthus]QDP19217.1 helix-turn-helix transcriptional regulator [Sphingomonas xanthus]